jgi:hypothetical protein
VRHAPELAEVLVLTSGSIDVSGGEDLDPVKAMLHGTVRTLALECPDLRWRLLDVGPRLTDDEVVAELLAHPLDPSAAEVGATAEVVALRRDHRWGRTERPYRPAGAGTGPSSRPSNGTGVLRPDAVYLITGGFGALGLELAAGLARSGLRPRLALVGRREPTTPVQAALADLEALGAQVRTLRPTSRTRAPCAG